MKRLVAGIMALVYVFTTTGFVADTHYCMGKIASVEIDHFSKAYCNSCNDNKSCCRHEVKLYKLNVEHKQTTANFSVKVPSPIFSIVSAYYHPSLLSTRINKAAQTKAPPLISSNTLFLLNCVFRV
jgi:hypothetical protein